MLFADSGFPEGATNPKRGRLIYYFDHFPPKMHEIENNSTHRVRGSTPLGFLRFFNGMNYQFVVLDFNVWATLVKLVVLYVYCSCEQQSDTFRTSR